MSNINIYANYDWLHINKALGFWKSDNVKKQTDKKLEKTFVAIVDRFRVQ